MSDETPGRSQPEWEKIIEGDIETWRLKVKGGWLWRVDIYSAGASDGCEGWKFEGTTMSFVPA